MTNAAPVATPWTPTLTVEQWGQVYNEVGPRLWKVFEQSFDAGLVSLIDWWDGVSPQQQYTFYLSREPWFEPDGLTPGPWLQQLIYLNKIEAAKEVERYRQLKKMYEGRNVLG